MAKDFRAMLVGAKTKGTLIRLTRRFERSKIRGYVLDIGPEFFLLALVSDRIRFDGFECFRVRDILGVNPDPYATFAEAALKRRGFVKPRKPRLNVTNIGDLLRSAGELFPLVTIHREQVDPDVCWIGRVLNVYRGRVSLLEIGPDAAWDSAPSEYRLKEITRANFGGDYENALHLVGGDPPKA